MAILDFLKTKKDTGAAAPAATDVKETKKETPPPSKSRETIPGVEKLLLISPVVSEKANMLHAQRKYVFRFVHATNRTEIKNFVERYYHVRVTGVNMVRVAKRVRGRTRYTNIRPLHKKAIITLAEGQEIKTA